MNRDPCTAEIRLVQKTEQVPIKLCRFPLELTPRSNNNTSYLTAKNPWLFSIKVFLNLPLEDTQNEAHFTKTNESRIKVDMRATKADLLPNPKTNQNVTNKQKKKNSPPTCFWAAP